MFALDAIAGSFTVPTSGSQDVGSLGFDPNLVLLYWTSSTADGNAVDYSSGIGIVTAGEQLALYGRQTDGSLNADGYHDTGSCIAIINSSDVVTERFTCAFGTTGQNKFTVTTVTGGAAVKVFYIAMTVTAAKLVAFQTNTTTADQAITGAGFAPDALFFLTAGIQDTDITNQAATYSHLGFGFAASASSEVGLGNSVLSASNADTGSQSSSKSIYVPTTSAMWLEGDIKSMDLDGATIQWTTVQGTAVAAWLLFIDGVQANCGAFNQTNGTGDSTVSSIGFTPEAIGFGSFCLASASGQQSNARMALGGAASTSLEGGFWSGAASGNNTADHAFDSDEALMCWSAGTPTNNSRGNVTSIGSGTFTLSWTVADSTLRQVVWWALGDLASAARRVVIVQ